MEHAAALGIGIAAILKALGIAFFVNSLFLWLTARWILSIPDATLWRCGKTVLAMSVFTLLSYFLLIFMALIPLIGPIIWLIIYLKGMKATVETFLEINEGGWTVLIMNALVQIAVFWAIRQMQ